MKKTISLLMALMMAVMLCACGASNAPAATTAAPETTAATETTAEETTTAEEPEPEIPGFGGIPDGRYTYVETEPEINPEVEAGQVQFDYWTDTINWLCQDGQESGSAVLEGDELEFFQDMFIADHPVTDWFGGEPKDPEGYAGYIAGNVLLDFTEGKLSRIRVDQGPTRTVAMLTPEITAPTLEISGATRGRPNLLQSCITLMGAVNGLYLTMQGDVILDNLTIGNDNGVGLTGDKIGGDTFVVGTVTVDGTVEWHGKMGVITALGSEPGILETNGYDISMTGGSNVGRVGRDLTISTGADKPGNIYIGAEITTDSTRGGLLPTADTSNDGLIVSTSGKIIAGKGDVIIGTNTEKKMTVDVIGGIDAANVTIKPFNAYTGAIADVMGLIGEISASGDVDIAVGNVRTGEGEANLMSLNGFADYAETGDVDKVIGNITAGGNITFSAGDVAGNVGEFKAGGTVDSVFNQVDAPPMPETEPEVQG